MYPDPVQAGSVPEEIPRQVWHDAEPPGQIWHDRDADGRRQRSGPPQTLRLRPGDDYVSADRPLPDQPSGRTGTRGPGLPGEFAPADESGFGARPGHIPGPEGLIAPGGAGPYQSGRGPAAAMAMARPVSPATLRAMTVMPRSGPARASPPTTGLDTRGRADTSTTAASRCPTVVVRGPRKAPRVTGSAKMTRRVERQDEAVSRRAGHGVAVAATAPGPIRVRSSGRNLTWAMARRTSERELRAPGARIPTAGRRTTVSAAEQPRRVATEGQRITVHQASPRGQAGLRTAAAEAGGRGPQDRMTGLMAVACLARSASPMGCQ